MVHAHLQTIRYFIEHPTVFIDRLDCKLVSIFIIFAFICSDDSSSFYFYCNEFIRPTEIKYIRGKKR